jgi:hypothetical protein
MIGRMTKPFTLDHPSTYMRSAYLRAAITFLSSFFSISISITMKGEGSPAVSVNNSIGLGMSKIVSRCKKNTFDEFEKGRKVRALIDNLVDYFSFCWDARNKILHGYVYPTLIANQRELQLVTQAKKSRMRTYLNLDLPTIRELADCMAVGRLQAANIAIYLSFRDTPPSRRPLWLRMAGRQPLPKILHTPKHLVKLERPPNNRGSPCQPKSLGG